MFLTHILDSEPTEVHVFQQFAVGMPLIVGIPATRALWRVENGRISPMQETLPSPPAS